MSEWFYIRLAFGLTWGAIVVYALLLNRRRLVAERAIRELGGGSE